MNKRLAGWYVALILFLLSISPQNIVALLPSNIHSSIPDDGGILLGDTVRFYGDSLEYADVENYKVIDVTSGGEVETSSDLDCAWEGEGEEPGCVQRRCVLAITLIESLPMHEYEISFEDPNIRYDPTFHFFGSDEDVGEDHDSDGITDKQGDCNDNNPEIYPGAIERCDEIVDRDCDGNYSVCCNDNGSNGCFIISLQY